MWSTHEKDQTDKRGLYERRRKKEKKGYEIKYLFYIFVTMTLYANASRGITQPR